MHHSMTAFARASAERGGIFFNIELRTVNHRYLDISPRLPESIRHLESSMRELIQKKLKRGKVDFWINYELKVAQQKARLNTIALNSWLEQLNNASAQDFLGKPTWQDLLALPDVITPIDIDTDGDDEWLLCLFQTAIEKLISMRAREGLAIVEVLKARLKDIEHLLAQLQAHSPKIQDNIKKTLQARLAELKSQVDLHRFEQELIYLLSKADIEEELDRLNFHVKEARHALSQPGAIGRRLDFLMQEFNRESNTLGAKAADNQLSQASVELKVLIEQMREQIQNLE